MASRNRQVRAIEEEASRRAAADGKTSYAERYKIRNELRAQQGLGREKKERGGVAGVWDRNKGPIGSIAGGLAASFIPGAGAFLLPALGGAIGGAAARGKFDAGNLMGDAMGGVGGGAIRPGIGALQSAFAPKAAMQAGQQVGAGAVPMAAPGAGAMQAAQQAGQGMATQAPGRLAAMGHSALNFARANPNAIGMAAQGAGQMMNANAQRQTANRQMDLQERQYEDEQEQRRRIAELLLPLWNRQQGQGPMPTPGLPRLGA